MNVEQAQTPRVLELARQIELDIARRGLQPGDSYLNTGEVAQLLGVNRMVANRAMQLLAQRRRIVRKQRRGTTISEPAPMHLSQPIESLLLLVQAHYLSSEGLLGDGVIVGISHEFPGLDVQFIYVPSGNESALVDQTINQCLRAEKTTGLLLVRSSLETQRLVAESGLPAVIYGTPQPSITSLSSIDRDQYQIGQLCAEHVLSRGQQRLLVLMRDRMYAGEPAFQDGLQAAASRRGLKLDSVYFRDLPADKAAVSAEVGKLLHDDPTSLGIIARSEALAEGAVEAIENQGLAVGRDVALAVADVYRRGTAAPPRYPYIKGRFTPEQQGREIGTLLKDAVMGQPVRHVTVPVDLV
ncbi:MAG: substrate-binding domain-containing protein [Phycisphaeraceae bacterium]|nr:substrate-binding domain-containing protein [Phycisphaeraceae bacterium]